MQVFLFHLINLWFNRLLTECLRQLDGEEVQEFNALRGIDFNLAQNIMEMGAIGLCLDFFDLIASGQKEKYTSLEVVAIKGKSKVITQNKK